MAEASGSFVACFGRIGRHRHTCRAQATQEVLVELLMFYFTTTILALHTEEL